MRGMPGPSSVKRCGLDLSQAADFKGSVWYCGCLEGSRELVACWGGPSQPLVASAVTATSCRSLWCSSLILSEVAE